MIRLGCDDESAGPDICSMCLIEVRCDGDELVCWEGDELLDVLMEGFLFLSGFGVCLDSSITSFLPFIEIRVSIGNISKLLLF